MIMKQKRLTKKEIQSIKEPKAIESIVWDVTAEEMMTHVPINLDLSGVFFISSIMNQIQGENHHLKYTKEFSLYERRRQRIAQKHGITSDAFLTEMSHFLRELEIVYEPVIRHFSIVKIMLTCCVESYINEVASTCLKGKKLDEFDKLSIFGKWIFIQDLLKMNKKLEIGKRPFQGLQKLITERNKITHFKGMRRSLFGFEVPDFLNDLKLTPKDCQSNIDSVRNLIIEFNLSWRDSYGPNWLNELDEGYRNPCFYLGSREASMVLYSEKYDKGR